MTTAPTPSLIESAQTRWRAVNAYRTPFTRRTDALAFTDTVIKDAPQPKGTG